MEIKGRHILITGASRGIGKAFAKVCAQDKANLHLVLRKADAALVQELTEEGAKSVTVWTADLSSRSSIDKLLKALEGQTIDILFNNAGLLTGGLLEDQPLDNIYDMFQVNINALVHLTHGILPGMLKRKRGKIINNSSVAAYMHVPCASTYSASKAAVVAFTESLRGELKPSAVNTLLLITPAIKTQMFDQIEVLYGKNFEIPQGALPVGRYAEMIREAVLHDLEVLEPSGLTGLGLKIAKFIPPLFEFGVGKKFKR